VLGPDEAGGVAVVDTDEVGSPVGGERRPTAHQMDALVLGDLLLFPGHEIVPLGSRPRQRIVDP
jgi:hypothetical protein